MNLDGLNIECTVPPIEPELLDRIGHLRVAAWQEESGVDKHIAEIGSWIDEHDATAIHWEVYTKAERDLVGAARLTFYESLANVSYADKFAAILDRLKDARIAGMSRLVLRKPVHHRGLWQELDRLRIERAREEGVDCILAICGSYRLDKLQSEGFELIGDTFSEAELPNHSAFPICLWLT